MRRRDFIASIGVTGIAMPLAARAQQAGKLPTVGYLGSGTASNQGQWMAAFAQRLREFGWIDGRTVAIQVRWADGRTEGMREIADAFVRLKIDVIFTYSTQAAIAAKQATSSIPIVFTLVGDPVGSGLVASLARSGGNVTGLSTQSPDLAGKRLELLREMLPALRRLAILTNVGNPSAVLDMREASAAARGLGLMVENLEIRQAQDIGPALESLKGRADALYVPLDPLAFINRVRVNTFALGERLPTVYGYREFVEASGLMSYGANFPDLIRRGGDYVDKILRGARPADLPIEQPTKFDFVINQITAKAIGLEIPPALLARADEVIE